MIRFLSLILFLSIASPVHAQGQTFDWQRFEIDGRPAFMILPAAEKRQSPMTWVMYAPTFDRSSPNEPSEGWMIGRFLDAGIAIAGVDVGESYGSPTGVATYNSLYEHLTTSNENFAPKACLLARSRGGLMLYNWAVSGILGTRFGKDHTFDMKVNDAKVHGDIGDGSNWIETAVNFYKDDTGSNGQGGDLDLDRWYHIVYVTDDTTKEYRLYLDADLKKSIPFKGTPQLMQPGQQLRIGCSSPSEFMDGLIDEVTIWPTAISHQQVLTLQR